MRSRLVWITVMVFTAFLISDSQAMAAHLSCGDTIKQSTTLDNDLVDCPGNGINIGAAGITLNLGGHTVDGTGNSFGIAVGRRAGVTVRNGTVRRFLDGVVLLGAYNSTLEDLTLTENTADGASLGSSASYTVHRVTGFANGGSGIEIGDTAGSVVTHNESYGNRGGIAGSMASNSLFEDNSSHDNRTWGMLLMTATGVRLADNRVADNGAEGILLSDDIDGDEFVNNQVSGSGADGILLTGDNIGSNLFERNRSDGNGDDGIDLDGPGSTLTRNTANFNADLGIEAVPGVTNGGGNKARGNGNPAQCLNVTCK
jgi:hypothetical protein